MNARRTTPEIYRSDPRYIGAYGLREAARILVLPEATLRSWVRGRGYRAAGRDRFSEPLIALPDPGETLLCFTNVVEAHVLSAIRRRHGVPMQQVRPALRFLEEELDLTHPLAHAELETDGLSLFVEKYGQLINLSQEGQLAIRELLLAHLRRIEHDAEGLASRLFPFTRGERLDAPHVVVIDPRISFGQPVVAGTGIRTSVLAARLKAGESIQELAEDYRLGAEKVEEAIRYELRAA